MSRSKTSCALAALTVALFLALMPGSQALGQKYGGVLRALISTNPPSLSVQETATQNAQVPAMPMYSNLVLFDPKEPVDSVDTIIPELAESWARSADARALTFKLRRGVRFHDGHPFTAADVKHTFDVVRGVKRSGTKLNPRKGWFVNVEEIVTNGDHEVTFRLKQPQPSLLVMLAAGVSPVYPAHMPFGELRVKGNGTGPFRLKSYERDKRVLLEKNPDYFVKGRPYLDGIEVIVIKSRASRTAALIAGQADISYSTEITLHSKKQIEEAVPAMQFQLQTMQIQRNLLMNTRKPPFDNAELRRAISLAIDRKAFIRAVHHGLAVRGGAMLPRPLGVWGLADDELAGVPGMGEPARDTEAARAIMRKLGYGPDKPLKVTLSTRASASYVDISTYVIGELRNIWVDATLEQVETGPWQSKMARREFTIAGNLTAVAVDDPDVNFYENYACGSSRNFTDYCNLEVAAKVEAQSKETDLARRQQLVREIDLQLQHEGARPMLAHPQGFVAKRPEVRDYVVHNSIYNSYRFQDVWLDR